MFSSYRTAKRVVRTTMKIRTLQRSRKFKVSSEAGYAEEGGSRLWMNTFDPHMQKA
jgi:hypothetical protein